MLSIRLSLFLLRTRLYVVRCCSILQHPRTAHFIRAIVSSKLPQASSVSSFPPCFASLSRDRQRARSFLVLPSTPRRNVLIRLTAFARHAFRLIPLLYRVTADRSHILGRRISKLETHRENQPAGWTFVVPDAEDVEYLGKTCVTRSFWLLASRVIFSAIIIHIMS